MQVKVSIHEKYEQPEIVVCNREMNDEVRSLANIISQVVNQDIVGYCEGEAVMLNQAEIIRIYAENQHVYAETLQGKYSVRSTLHELESQLQGDQFVRISKSELVNVKKIKRMDTSMAGTIRIYLQGDVETYVSRRNIPMIRKTLLGGARE